MNRMVAFFALIPFLLIQQEPLQAMVRAGVEVDNDDDGYYYYDYGYWQGPGFYYGIWFDDEGEYNNWRHGHNHYRGGYYHGGGGHGGGHGGGGHR